MPLTTNAPGSLDALTMWPPGQLRKSIAAPAGRFIRTQVN